MEIKTRVINVKTTKKNEMINITKEVQNAVSWSNVRTGIVTLFVPHTTAAVTINENADPDVKIDLIKGLVHISPDRDEYRHYEGNSDAHIKSSLVGVSENIIIEDGLLMLGTWQGVYYCEFDGPRTRELFVKIIEG